MTLKQCHISSPSAAPHPYTIASIEEAVNQYAIPGNPHERLNAYRRLKAAGARPEQGQFLQNEQAPDNGAFQET